jgi:beta-alanine degradation protein BauB
MVDVHFPQDPIAPDPSWPEWLKHEFKTNTENAMVGGMLVSEAENLRVWHILLDPGKRLPVHKHVLNYFWTVISPGSARSHYHDGSTVEMSYKLGETVHHRYAKGEFMMHDLENIGQTPLGFTTVEYLDSPNEPIPLKPAAQPVGMLG